MKKYSDIYIEVRKRLKEAGISSYALETRLIVAAAAGKTQAQFVRDMNLYVNEGFEKKVSDMMERRLAGEPVAYITGEWEFYGLPIVVNSEVLIPRNDTEVLAEKAIELLKGRQAATRVLDLCCGSGCIGAAIAANVFSCRVILADISLAALRVCRQNVNRNNLNRSITCVEADALKNPPVLIGRFDMIVCNPPYIPTSDLETLDSSVKNYEPMLALNGGADGLDFYRSVASKWRTVLKDRGCLMFETGFDQAEQVSQIMKENGFKGVHTFCDTAKIPRVVAGIYIDE